MIWGNMNISYVKLLFWKIYNLLKKSFITFNEEYQELYSMRLKF